jgi:hypothetical protein
MTSNWEGNTLAGHQYDAGTIIYGVFTSITLQRRYPVPLRKVASKLMVKFGGVATINRVTAGAYNATTGTASETTWPALSCVV